MTTMRPQRFAASPPPTHAWLMLVALAGLVPLVAIGFVLWTLPEAKTGLHALWSMLLVIPLLLVLLTLAMKRRSVELCDGVLDVRAALFRSRTAVTELDLERARIVNLTERTELRPVVKTGGMSLPGFHAGHFRLREKLGKAFCLLTDHERVLWLPRQDGKSQLLLSLERPQALLDALKAARH